MNIGMLGTGSVGQAIAAKLADIGHAVVIGTRDPAATLARASTGDSFPAWLTAHPSIKLVTFAEAGAFGEILINATVGHGSIPALAAIAPADLDGKIIIDISNPLDFSKGMPPTLFVSNDDSLGEQIQRRFPSAKVVKTLNTVTAALMVNPSLLANADHTLFVSGNDADAKTAVVGYLGEWFGWKDVIDMGDITTARGAEAMLHAWIRLWGTLGTGIFNFKVVR